MDVALKQRLVGASVLVALGVILIPMLLEGPRDAGNAASIPIPEQPERGFETRLLPVNANTGGAPETPEPASGERPEVVAVDAVGGTGTTPATSPAGGDSALPEGPRRWILQLGSFGNAANAARLVSSLVEAGWSAYQEKVIVADHTLYRVRAGAWSSKEEAAEVGMQIVAQFTDLDVSVHSLEAAGGVSAVSGLSGWMVQVGSFSEQANAYQLRDRLRAAGQNAHVEVVTAATGDGYKVRVGPELDRADAQRLRERLKAEFDLNGIIVNHP